MAFSWSSASSSPQSWRANQDSTRPSSQSTSRSTTWPPTPTSRVDLVPGTTHAQDHSSAVLPHERLRIHSLASAGPLGACRELPTTADTPSQPDPYDPFFIPQSVLFDAPISPQPDSKLLQLPPEILSLIFKQVKIPYFQVTLALTCKTLARTASQKHAMSPWRGYRDKDGLFRLLERKNKWMPQSIRLCRACFRYRPKDATYWEREFNSPEFDNMKANWYDIFSWFEPTYQQHRCPWCTISGYTSYFREEQYIEDRDQEPRARRHPMCPDVIRRIAKP